MFGLDRPAVLWLVVLAAAVGTYVLRVSFVTLFGRLDEVPTRVKRVLAFVPPAVLAALVLPELVLRGDALAVSLGNRRLLAGLFAAAVAWKTEDMLATLVAGMAALYVLSLLP
jgi:branched-subunit amino acid transport protein